MIFAVLFTALALVVTSASPAHAEPITLAILGAIGIKATATAIAIGNLIIGLIANYALGLLAKLIAPKQLPQGAQVQLEVGDEQPIGFIAGTYATRGKRVYYGTWGRFGKTPNAYLVDVISVGDLPAPGQPKIWVNGKLSAIDWNATPGERGYPVTGWVKGSEQLLWVHYLDGTQTEAHPYLIAKFGNDPERPWLADMIGRGIPMLIVTALHNQEIFGGRVEVMIQPPPTPMYDIRKDSTAGGSGSHRYGQNSTYEPTSNAMVIAYNVSRGIYYDNGAGYREWVFGGQELPAFRLPASAWMAAMNACDLEVDLADESTEPQFRSGYEIRGEMEPLAVIEEFLMGCTGRMIEIGGLLKPLVGIPGTAVYSFTDANVMVTETQQYQPFPRLAETHNAIEATYPEPEEAWANKEAPKLIDAELEAEDGGRRLPVGVTFSTVPFHTQVQRLQRAVLLEARRFRTHVFHLPPEAWLLEPGDIVAWTSVRNGYSNKLFMVVEIIGQRSFAQQVTLKEIDPDDYDWNVELERPITISPTGPVPIPAQDTPFDAVPIVVSNGTSERHQAGIRMTWDNDQEDVIAVEWVIRRAVDAVVVNTARSDRFDLGYADETRNLFSNTAYQVMGRYIPGTPRSVEWSVWINVVTPDVQTNDVDFTEIREFVEESLEWLNEESPLHPLIELININTEEIARSETERLELGVNLAGRLRNLNETVLRTNFRLLDGLLQNTTEQTVIRQESVSAEGRSRSYAEDIVLTAVGPGSAVAQRLTTIEASAETDRNNVNAAVTGIQEAIVNAITGEATARNALKIQLIGNYNGGDINGVTEGLLYQSQQAWITETEALAQSISGISAGVGVLFDWVADWQFNTSAEGWTSSGGSATGGWFRPGNHATNPVSLSPDNLNIDGDAYKQVKIRIRKTGTPSWAGRFYWNGPGDTNFTSLRRTDAPEPIFVDGIAVVTIDMGWSGQIRRLRIDLSNVQDATNYFEIDWVSIGRPSPGASRAQVTQVQQALSSALIAEASERSALSTTLIGTTDPSGATLENITNGIVFEERQARSTADAALSVLVTGVSSQVTALNGTVLGLSGAQNALESRVTTTEGLIATNAANISSAIASIAGKAESSAVDNLQAQINELGGTDGFQVLGRAIRSVRLTVDHLAAQSSDLLLGLQRGRNEMGQIVAEASQSLTSRIDLTNTSLTLLGQIVTQVQLSLPGYASLTALNSLSGRVVATENSIVTLGTNVNAVTAALTGYTGANAVATAFNTQNVRITDAEGEVESIAEQLLGVQVDVDNVTANGRIKFEAMASPGDSWSRIGVSVAASEGGAFQQAALLLEARTSGTIRSRAGFYADQFFLLSSTGSGLMFQDGVWSSDNNKLRIDFKNGRIEAFA